MRSVGVRGTPKAALLSHLVALAALAIMLALVAPAADASDEVAALPQQAASAAPADDYYTRRAKSILDAEKAAEAKPHPLAVPYPGMDVVVCEAGCARDGHPEIVFLRRYFVSAASESGRASPSTSGTTKAQAKAPAASPAKTPACVGGCYSGVASLMVPVSEVSEIGEWSTTVSKPIERDKLSPIR
jgi:hypothetical protein